MMGRACAKMVLYVLTADGDSRALPPTLPVELYPSRGTKAFWTLNPHRGAGPLRSPAFNRGATYQPRRPFLCQAQRGLHDGKLRQSHPRLGFSQKQLVSGLTFGRGPKYKGQSHVDKLDLNQVFQKLRDVRVIPLWSDHQSKTANFTVSSAPSALREVDAAAAHCRAKRISHPAISISTAWIDPCARRQSADWPMVFQSYALYPPHMSVRKEQSLSDEKMDRLPCG